MMAILSLCVHASAADTLLIPEHSTTTELSETPVGQVFAAFLEAFNSHDKEKLAEFVRQYAPNENAEFLYSFSNRVGGFTLLSIVHSDAKSLTVQIRENAPGGRTVLANFLLSSTALPKLESKSFRRIPPGSTVNYSPLDAGARREIVNALSEKLTKFYIYPELAQKMVATIHEHSARGDYDTLTDGYTFARALQLALRAAVEDEHLYVEYNAFKMPQDAGGDQSQKPTKDELALLKAQAEQSNCDFSKVDILPGNIGYLKFDSFTDPELCAPTATAALNFLAHTDAVIVDIRSNGGGEPSMVDYIASYFFSEPTHINDLYDRHNETTTQYWTLPYVSGSRIMAPLYVLTSHLTFSGAEEFAYDMQTQKRGIIVGETTGGGAHPADTIRLPDQFTVDIPTERPINPVTKKDWEGTGVIPDVIVSSSDALNEAVQLATKKLSSR